MPARHRHHTSCFVVCLVACGLPLHRYHPVFHKNHHHTACDPLLREQQKWMVVRGELEPGPVYSWFDWNSKKPRVLECQSKQRWAAPGQIPPEHTRQLALCLINATMQKKKNKRYEPLFTLDSWSYGDPHWDLLITVWISITPWLLTEPQVVRWHSRTLCSKSPSNRN